MIFAPVGVEQEPNFNSRAIETSERFENGADTVARSRCIQQDCSHSIPVDSARVGVELIVQCGEQKVFHIIEPCRLCFGAEPGFICFFEWQSKCDPPPLGRNGTGRSKRKIDA